MPGGCGEGSEEEVTGTQIEESGKVGQVGLMILGKGLGFYFRSIAFPFIYFACRKPFRI